MGGDLVSINDAGELKFVSNNVTKGMSLWTGGSDASKDRSFVWVDGTAVQVKLFPGLLSKNNKVRDYLVLTHAGQGQLRQDHGNFTLKGIKHPYISGYICEWDTPAPDRVEPRF